MFNKNTSNMEEIKTKVCNVCKRELPIDAFNKKQTPLMVCNTLAVSAKRQ
jgi:hypothetical protein